LPKANFSGPKKDEDYYLQHSKFRFLPLSEIQKTKINSALGQGRPAVEYLSPKQLMWLQNASEKNSPILYDKDFQETWSFMNLK